MEEDHAADTELLANANAQISFLMRERDEARAQNTRLRARNREWREAFRQLRDELASREQTVLELNDEIEVLRSRVPKDTIIPPLAFASWDVAASQSLDVSVAAGTKHQTILDVMPGAVLCWEFQVLDNQGIFGFKGFKGDTDIGFRLFKVEGETGDAEPDGAAGANADAGADADANGDSATGAGDAAAGTKKGDSSAASPRAAS